MPAEVNALEPKRIQQDIARPTCPTGIGADLRASQETEPCTSIMPVIKRTNRASHCDGSHDHTYMNETTDDTTNSILVIHDSCS